MVYAYHQQRERYFDHQYRVTRDHVLPFVELSGPLPEGARVLEIGCGEAGVLKAFLERGAITVGVDRSAPRLARGRELLAEQVQAGRVTLLLQDAQELGANPAYQSYFDLIVLKDVIEHIDDRPGLFEVMAGLLRPGGRIFLAFPPWRMPFGGHQQICRSWVLSRTPYFHLLPTTAYRKLLRLFGEQPARIDSLMATKRTGLHSADFESLVKDAGFEVAHQRFYLINPMYTYRFKITPREQASWISARSRLRDFVTTCAYYTVKPVQPTRPLLQPLRSGALAALLAGLAGYCVALPAAAQDPAPAAEPEPAPAPETAPEPAPAPPPPPVLPPVAPPAGLSSQAPASTGSTVVAQEGFQKVADAPAPDSKDSATFKLTAGGFLSTGNSRSLALTGVVDYFLRRGPSQFGAQLAANYGEAAQGRSGSFERTVENYQARIRYDHFFSGSLAGFLSVSARRDEFQELDLRLNVDPGFAYYFIDEKDQRLWAELGYDLQHDVRRQELVDLTLADPLVPDVERTETRHNARVFAGYVNQVNPSVKFNAGVEYLQNIPKTENARVNIDLGLTSQFSDSLSIATTVSVKYDNNPLPEVKSTDVVTALNLVYTLDY